MDEQRISIVNKSTGKYRTEEINGREHLVTSMMAIEGDSVMNGLLYPNNAVAASFGQLDMLPAPDGHPDLDGNPISAFNPLAINAHNFGGFTRSPRLDGKRVITDLAIDLTVANQTERGKKIVNRIKSGKRIGVSTGLIAQVSEASGKINNQEFFGRVNEMSFDHVAVLLDAMPAGENTYTINHGVKQPPKRGMLMDKLELDLTSLALEDRLALSNLNAKELLSHIKHEVTVKEAQGIVTNAGFEFYRVSKDEMDTYLANKDAFEEYKAGLNNKLQETKEFIVANSKMAIETLNGMDQATLDDIAKSVAPAQKYIGNGKVAEKPVLVLLDDDKLEA